MYQISIIVPIYNMEKYMEKCIDSILAQTFRSFECILVDDGSEDHSLEICKKYESLDERIKVVHNKHSGLGETRNVGIRNVSGRYLSFIDSDDYIEPDMLERMYAYITKQEADIVECGFEQIYANGDRPVLFKSCKKAELLSGRELLLRFNDDGSVVHFILCNKLFRTELFDGIAFPFGKVLEDEYVLYQILYRANKVVLCEECFYKYYRRADSIINTCSVNRIESYLEFNEQRLCFFREKDKEIYNTLLKVYFVTVFYYYNDIYKLTGYKRYKKGLLAQAVSYYKDYFKISDVKIWSKLVILYRLFRMKCSLSTGTRKYC